MDQSSIIMTSIICATLFLSVLVVMLGRLKFRKQDQIQKLMDDERMDQEQLMKLLHPQERYGRDFRRGALLIGVGLSTGVVFFFMGGVGWKLALIPIVTGMIYLWLWWLNAPRK